MSTTTRWTKASALVLVVLAACAGRGSQGLVAASPRSDGPEMLIAYGCPEPVEPEPDFTFTPRPRGSRTAARPLGTPRLDTLPRLVENAGCTRPGRALE